MQLTVIILLTLFFRCKSLSEDEIEKEWTKFQKIYERSYESDLEKQKRFVIFHENLLGIEKHNEDFNNGRETYQQDITKFTDLTVDEFLEFVNKFKLNSLNFEEITADNISVPTTVDWRLRAVREVKDQGQCGSSWSFSATGALEGQAYVQKNLLASFSEQNLIDCATTIFRNDGCNGGNMIGAFEYVKQNGIDSDSSYKYEDGQGNCRHSRTILRISGYAGLTPGETNLRNAVANIGPIAVAVEVTANLQFYRSGILDDKDCNQRLNHGALVVGYGTYLDQDYWLIKNSWGSLWGEAGYFKFARNTGDKCGVSKMPSFPKF